MFKLGNMCCCVGVLIGVALTGALLGIFMVKKATREMTELRQVHVIFSHGERTPTADEIELFPLSSQINESYHPYGLNSLTNEGKMTVFKIGERIRRDYDTFLTKSYNQEESNIRAIDSDLSKMSALVLLAGLWPVDQRQMWTDIKWLPIPYKYSPANIDHLLYENNCPRYIKEKRRVTRKYFKDAMSAHQETFEKLSTLTGHNITEPSQVLKLVKLLISQRYAHMKMPEWFKGLKKPISDIIRTEYNIMFYNTLLQRLSAGALLDGIFRHAMQHVSKEEINLKLQMYSVLLNNVAAISSAIEDKKLYPRKFGETLIVELHFVPFLNDYAIKILTWENEAKPAKIIKLSGCDELCPITSFEKKIIHLLHVNYEEECKYT